MRTPNEIYDSAIEGSPFSNSTEWELWAANWCYRCKNDGIGIGKDEPNCELICTALVGKTPLEWLTGNDDLRDRYHCIEFRDRDGRGDDGPRSGPPPMPGQGLLFDPEPYRGVRMWADVVNEIRPQSVGAS